MKLYQLISYFFMQKVTRYISHLINLLIIIFVRPEKLSEGHQRELDLLNRKRNSLTKDIYDFNKKYEHICYSCNDICCAKGEGDDRYEPVDFLLDKKIRSNKRILLQKNSEWYELKIKRSHIINEDKASPCPHLDPQKGCRLKEIDRPILCPQWYCKEFYKVWTMREVVKLCGYLNKTALIRMSVLRIAMLSFLRRQKSGK